MSRSFFNMLILIILQFSAAVSLAITFFQIDKFMHNILVWLVCLLSVANLFFIYFMSKNYQRKIDAENEALYLEYEMSLHKAHLNNIQNLSEVVDLYKTQSQKDLLAVYQSISENESNKAQVELERLNQIHQQLRLVDYCDNPIINAILYPKCQYLLAHDIPFEILLSNVDENKIDTMSLVCIFSNLIDNGIEAIETLDTPEDTYIFLSSEWRMGFYTIYFENTKREDVSVSIGTTTKEDSELHGHGLGIINDIVKKFNGKFSIQDKGQSVAFNIVLQGKE